MEVIAPEVHPLADVGVARGTPRGTCSSSRGRSLASTSPPIRQFGPMRHAAAEVGAEELGVAADVARALDPGERLDPRPGGDRDRAVGRVEDGVRIDPGRLVDRRAGRPGRPAPAVARWRLLTADASLRRRSRGRGGRRSGRRCPRAARSTRRRPPGPPAAPPTSSNQASTAFGSSADGLVGPDQGAGGLAVAEPEPGAVGIGRLEAVGRHPAAVDHQHRPPRQPVAIVDRGVRVARLLDGRQVRPDHHAAAHRARPDPERAARSSRRACWSPGAGRTPDASGSAAPGRRRHCPRPGRDASIPSCGSPASRRAAAGTCRNGL